MAGIRNARRFSATLAVAALLGFCGAGSDAAVTVAPSAPAVPVDVRIPVVLTTPLTSQTAHVGDAFGFQTTRDEKLGSLAVPAGTPGTGRLAAVEAAHDKQHGSITLQADKLQLASGEVVWVNVDTSRPPTGHLADKHTRFYVLPLPIGVVPGFIRSVSGNLILDAGTGFGVVTIAPRTAPAPLVTTPPTPQPSAAAT